VGSNGVGGTATKSENVLRSTDKAITQQNETYTTYTKEARFTLVNKREGNEK
jgi:hypothetical protein